MTASSSINPTPPISTPHSKSTVQENSDTSANLELIKGISYSAFGLINAGLSCYLTLFSDLHHFTPCLSANPNDCYTKLPTALSLIAALSSGKMAYDSFNQARHCFKKALA